MRVCWCPRINSIVLAVLALRNYDMQHRNANHSSCPVNATLFAIRFLVSAGCCLSALSLTGCKFVNRTGGNGSLFGLYREDVSFGYNTDVNGGACIAYSPALDPMFRTARACAVLGAVLGGVAAILMYMTRVVFFSVGHVVATGVVITLACLFQGLTFLVLGSEFCQKGGSDNVSTSCWLDRTGYLSVAAASCYLISFVACFSITPAVVKMGKEVEKEDVYDYEDEYA